jgi:hypothetical protein
MLIVQAGGLLQRVPVGQPCKCERRRPCFAARWHEVLDTNHIRKHVGIQPLDDLVTCCVTIHVPYLVATVSQAMYLGLWRISINNYVFRIRMQAVG